MKAILGKKIGMIQIFEEEKAVPVTVIGAGPCIVTQVKNLDKEDYKTVQLGFAVKKKLNKPQKGHLKKLGLFKYLREIRYKTSDKEPFDSTQDQQEIKDKELESKKEGEEKKVLDLEKTKVGDKITVDIFSPGDKVDIIGTSKGRGFAGVVKRHGFKSGPMSHGSDHHREPGSIGSMFPQRVFKGKKLPGRMGGDRVTIKNLEIIKIDPENNLLAVKGAVPGAIDGLLIVKSSKL